MGHSTECNKCHSIHPIELASMVEIVTDFHFCHLFREIIIPPDSWIREISGFNDYALCFCTIPCLPIWSKLESWKGFLDDGDPNDMKQSRHRLHPLDSRRRLHRGGAPRKCHKAMWRCRFVDVAPPSGVPVLHESCHDTIDRKNFSTGRNPHAYWLHFHLDQFQHPLFKADQTIDRWNSYLTGVARTLQSRSCTIGFLNLCPDEEFSCR